MSAVPLIFYNKINRLDSGCWEWTGTKVKGGYGVTYANRRTCLAHRVIYEILVGPIPAGLTLDHLCRNTSCVNPDHLEPVTIRENVLRSETHLATICSKKTHCPQGHPYSVENTKWEERRRRCRICAKATTKRYRDRKRRWA